MSVAAGVDLSRKGENLAVVASGRATSHAHCWTRIQELNERIERLQRSRQRAWQRASEANQRASLWEARFHANPRRNGGGSLRQRGLCSMCGVRWDELTPSCVNCRCRHRERQRRAAA